MNSAIGDATVVDEEEEDQTTPSPVLSISMVDDQKGAERKAQRSL